MIQCSSAYDFTNRDPFHLTYHFSYIQFLIKNKKLQDSLDYSSITPILPTPPWVCYIHGFQVWPCDWPWPKEPQRMMLAEFLLFATGKCSEQKLVQEQWKAHKTDITPISSLKKSCPIVLGWISLQSNINFWDENNFIL